jgi:hypothetical protein
VWASKGDASGSALAGRGVPRGCVRPADTGSRSAERGGA